MATTAPRAERRTDALSKERIVAAAIEILDAGGESALTFRALAARLATGSGAIYWHVANKDELLAATTDEVIGGMVAGLDRAAPPEDAIRALALGIYDALDAHPWVGASLFQSPWQPAMLGILEGMGSQVQRLGVPDDAFFDASTALVNYVLGVAGKNAANARMNFGGRTREEVLGTVSERWDNLDPAEYPFLRRIAGQMRDHDDRAQFLAGIDLILAGITTLR